ncbi:hypothetical protein FEM48_Zijuj10G0017900 [Ziziphus jujuba var. spinosa]|uniref:DC1 domain-containing protein n=1 Tax=Ziziphus jujuba var. spinosa TaxID=714518 RepID=A0A978UKK5_ZIZJJ|nr:hypothetical protein FEM48_Zijuj10G0017900 [Ziziphus jujuba var. spinosa]
MEVIADDHVVTSLECKILHELDTDIAKLGKVTKELIRKKPAEELLYKLKEIEESHGKAEVLKEIIPCHQHPLETYHFDLNGSRRMDKICQVCTLSLASNVLNKFPNPSSYRCFYGCDYYMHADCFNFIERLIRAGKLLHSLHPQHYLTLLRFDFNRTFACSFCSTSINSKEPLQYFLYCGACKFYLHVACSLAFIHRPKLLSNKYQIQHFLHHPHNSNHCLSPSLRYFRSNDSCNGCGEKYWEVCFVFECIACDNFSLHVRCSRLPKLITHSSHPQHRLTLIVPNSNTLGHCHGCRSSNQDKFVFHCAQCCFSIDIPCSYLKPNMIPNRHRHPLLHFEKIHLNDVRCSACNTPCIEDSFRCVPCNYNVHPQCIPLPSVVDYYDHIHPLTLTPSFREDDSGDYFCDICEERRDPDHGVYLCFWLVITYFEFRILFLWLRYTQWEASSTGKLGYDLDTSHREIEGTKAADDSNIAEETIYRQWHEEIAKLDRVVQGLIQKKKKGMQLTEEKLKELDERHADTECKLKHLKQSFRGTN